MSKTIKIIELLNKIANNERKPSKIIYEDEEYVWNVYYNNYVCCDHDLTPLFNNYTKDFKDFLNEEVEIIEEQEEIDIQSIEKIIDYRTSDDDLYNDNFEDFRGTINELIEAVKQLDKNIKEE